MNLLFVNLRTLQAIGYDDKVVNMIHYLGLFNVGVCFSFAFMET